MWADVECWQRGGPERWATHWQASGSSISPITRPAPPAARCWPGWGRTSSRSKSLIRAMPHGHTLKDRPDTDSLFFLSFNANKRSLTLNLKRPRGKEVFRALLKTADVLLENFGPGVLHRLGFDYPTVHQTQSAAGVREHQGLRFVRTVQRLQELRADRPGHGRGHERHRLPRGSAHVSLAVHRRFWHRHALRDRDPGRPHAAPRHRRGAAGRSVDAGHRGEPHPSEPARPSATGQADGAHGQPARSRGAGDDLPLPSRRPQRLRLHLRAAADVAPAPACHRARGSHRRIRATRRQRRAGSTRTKSMPSWRGGRPSARSTTS